MIMALNSDVNNMVDRDEWMGRFLKLHCEL